MLGRVKQIDDETSFIIKLVERVEERKGEESVYTENKFLSIEIYFTSHKGKTEVKLQKNK